MKMLHTSDWHLGRQFHNASLLEDQAHVLEQLIQIAAAEEVDVVLIAGDIYDRSVPPAAAVTLLNNTLNTLCNELNLPVILIAGNHDSPERLGFGAEHMQASGLHIFGPLSANIQPVLLSDAHGQVAFYGLPYVEPAHVRAQFDTDISTHEQAQAFLTAQIAAAQPAHRTVLINHCFVAGGLPSESERPLSVGGVDQVAAKHFLPFNYTALGHLHAPQQRQTAHIRYSGSLLKYSFSEVDQQKSVTIVDMAANGDCDIRQQVLTPLRDMRVIEGDLASILSAGKIDPKPDDYLLVRLTDRTAILDVMGKLREVYPNVLHIERPGLLATTDQQTSHRERLKKGELSMFQDFYQQIQGQPLSEPQQQLLTKLLGELRLDNR